MLLSNCQVCYQKIWDGPFQTVKVPLAAELSSQGVSSWPKLSLSKEASFPKALHQNAGDLIARIGHLEGCEIA